MDGGFPAALKEHRARQRLTQLELALRAGTTQRHVSFLESGRSAPGRTMVVRLAESLGLPLRERNRLLLAAGFAPGYPETRLDDPALAPVLTALNHLLDRHLPYPALVMDRYGELITSNQAVGILTAGVAPELLRPPANALHMALHPRGMAPRIRNLADWAQHILERLRQEVALAPDIRLEKLLAELEGYVPASTASADYLGFAVPLQLTTSAGELRLITAITAFTTAVNVTISELRLETFLPADDATAAVLIAAQREWQQMTH